jgi:ribosomal-protein-alanine N-acetyltransferase
MNGDPTVMEFFYRPLSRTESDALVDMYAAELDESGHCPWAVEELSTGAFIGFVGLHAVQAHMPFAPGTEVGWRLARQYWGLGYATEAGAAAVLFGFGALGLEEILSFTSVLNLRSRRVMERLGMSYDQADDFDHPNIAEGHPLRPHVLYRLQRGDQSP